MPEKRKILYIITKSAWGGAQRYVYDLAVHLDAGRFDIAVACGGTGPLTDALGKANIRTIPIPALDRDISVWADARSLWSLFRIMRRERPDIVHLSSSKAGGLGAIAAFFHKFAAGAWNTRVIFTAHGWPFREDRPAWQRGGIFLFSWLSTLFHDRVITITTADHRLARRFVPERKLALVFHGIEPIEFRPRAEARAFFAERVGPILSDTLIIGCTAELTKNKGIGCLIDAAHRMKFQIPNSPPDFAGAKSRRAGRFQTIVVGEGEERQRLQEKINALGLTDRMFLPGFVADARRHLTGLDLFVLPSVKEGLPYAIMEAMAAGLPIVASRVGGIPDLITDGETGLLVPPRDPTALAAALARLTENRALASRLGRQAHEAIARSFPLSAMIAKTAALYDAA